MYNSRIITPFYVLDIEKNLIEVSNQIYVKAIWYGLAKCAIHTHNVRWRR